jgi:membrane-associated phospholipid phosphatase
MTGKTTLGRWWPVVAAIVMCVIGATTHRLPGDLAIARLLQATVSGPEWALAVSGTVRTPQLFVLLAIAAGLCWWRDGLRTAMLLAAAFGLVWLIGEPIKELVQRPRPSADLVRVAVAPHGYGFPSTFATMWGITWLPVAIVTWRRNAPLDTVIALVAVMLLVVGLAARVVLGAHWPSDIAGAYLIALAGWTLVRRAAELLGRQASGG